MTLKKDRPVTLPLSDVLRIAPEALKKRPVISECASLASLTTTTFTSSPKRPELDQPTTGLQPVASALS